MRSVSKALHQLTVVEILDRLSHSNISSSAKVELEGELRIRNLSKTQMEVELKKLEVLKTYRQKREDEPLAIWAKVLCIFVPFYLQQKGKFEETSSGQVELDRWSEHGFQTKRKEYLKYSLMGLGFYGLLFIIFLIVKLA